MNKNTTDLVRKMQLFIVFALFVSSSFLLIANFASDSAITENGSVLRTADPETVIILNATEIYRGKEHLNITIDLTDSDLIIGDHSFTARIIDKDNEYFDLDMNQIGSSDLLTVTWETNITTTTGSTNVSIFIAGPGVTDGVDNYEMIEVQNNLPSCAVTLPSNELYRNNTYTVNITPSDYEQPVAELTWKLELFDQEHEKIDTLFDLTNSIFETELEIPAEFDVGFYYLQSTIQDEEDEVEQKHYFQVRNNPPVIVEKALNTSAVLRGNNVQIRLNVTDEDDLENLRLELSTYDPQTGQELLSGSDYTDIQALIADRTRFEFEFEIPYTISTGHYFITAKVYERDEPGVNDIVTLPLMVENNPPVIHEFLINGETDGDWYFHDNEEINFQFNAEDAEGPIQFIKVSIFYEDYAGNFVYYNYTVDYIGEATQIIVLTKDLPATVYSVYGYVIDQDGATTRYEHAYQFVISEDDSDRYVPWIMLGVGLAVGLAAGAFILSTRYKQEEEREIKGTRVVEKPKSAKLSPSQKRKLREQRRIGKIPAKSEPETKEPPKEERKQKDKRKFDHAL